MLEDGNIKPRLATRYLIKAGGKGPKGNPVKWDHFKICKNERDEQGLLIPDDEFMKKVCGTTKPAEIPFMFFSNNPTDCYDDGYSYRTKSQRLCFSTDGKTAHWSNRIRVGDKLKTHKIPEGIEPIQDMGETTGVVCLGPNCPMQTGRKCKINLRLVGYIPTDDGIFTGADVFFSSSYNSAAQLRASMHVLVTRTNGNIAFRPLTLRLQPKKALVDNKQLTVYVVDFYSAETPEQLTSGVQPVVMPSLAPPPAAIDMGDNEVIAEEYYPEEPTVDDMMPSKSSKTEVQDMSALVENDITPDEFSELDTLAITIKETMESLGKSPTMITRTIQTASREPDPVKAMKTLIEGFKGKEGELWS